MQLGKTLKDNSFYAAHGNGSIWRVEFEDQWLTTMRSGMFALKDSNNHPRYSRMRLFAVNTYEIFLRREGCDRPTNEYLGSKR